ncbi:MAG: serine hydrolase [Flavobacteriales bacterium]|nr:serine hydrolase [Flavobacteriales bacterium]
MRNLNSFILLLVVVVFISCNYRQNNDATSVVQDSRINNYLEACQSNGFNGSVLIVKNDSIILNKGFGLADKEDSIPNTPETVFDICSVTKQFTATAVLKLMEDGKLKLTDSLGMYFKDVPLDKRRITIHQLLSHSAGFDHSIGNGDFDISLKMTFLKNYLMPNCYFNLAKNMHIPIRAIVFLGELLN